MSFSRASLKRFNEIQGCAPPVGHYDPKGLKAPNGNAFNKSLRFQDEKDGGPSPADFDVSCCSGINIQGTGLPAVSSTPKKSISAASSMESLKEKKIKEPEDSALVLKCRKQEREIKKLLQENVDVRKELTHREEEHKKLEGRLQHALTERSTLMSQIATLKKTNADVNVSNNLLKTKLTAAEGSTKKRDDKVQSELTELRKQLTNKDKEISTIKQDIQTCVSALLQDLAVIIALTDKLNNKISQLEQSFDDKDIDSSVTEDKVTVVKSVSDLSTMINKAREDAKKIRSSLEGLSTTTDRQVVNFKAKLKEKHAGTVDKLQTMSTELLQMQEQYESSKLCNEALVEYRNALKTQNSRLLELVSRLRQDQWMSEDTIRNLKGEVFALSDENKVYEQQTFESYAELATLMERIELMEEREELRSTEAKVLTEENSILEQSAVELKQKQAEAQKLTAQLQNETEKLNSELDKSKAVCEELQVLVQFKSQMMADQDDRLKISKERIDDLSDKLNSVQCQLLEVKKSESSFMCDVAIMEKEVTELKTALSEAQQERDEGMKQIAVQKESLAMVTEELNDAMVDVAKLEAEKERIQLDYEDHLEREKLEFLQKIDELQHRLSTTEQELDDLQEEKNSEKQITSQRVADLQNQLSELETELSELKIEKESLIETSAKRLEVVQEHLSKTEHQLSELQEEKMNLIKSASQEENRLQSLVTEMETKIETLCMERDSEKESTMQKLMEVENQLAESENVKCQLQEECDSLKMSSSKQFGDLQSQLARAEQDISELQREKESERKSYEERLVEMEVVRIQLEKTEQELVKVHDEKESESEMSTQKQMELLTQLHKTESVLAELKEEKNNENQCAEQKICEIQSQLIQTEGEISELKQEKERMNASSAEQLNNFASQLEKSKTDLLTEREERKRETLSLLEKVKTLEAEVTSSRQESTELAQLREERDSCKLSYMQKMAEVVSQLAKTEQELTKTQEERKHDQRASAQELQELKSRLAKAERDLMAVREDRDRLHTQFEELREKVAPYMAQIEEFEAERHRLLGQSATAQCELKKLSKDYALILGHQNQRQKIKHVVKIKEENNALKEEVAKLQSQLWKLQRKLDSDLTKSRLKRGPLGNSNENITPRH